VARFRAHIIDPLRGETRFETVSATDADQASDLMSKRGFTVLHVEPYRARPGEPSLRSGLADFGRLLLKLLVLASVGASVFLLLPRWRSWSGGSGPTTVQLSITGELLNGIGGTPSPETVKIALRFPDVPFSRTWSGSEILKGDGSLAQKVEFVSKGNPGQAEVLVEVTGFETIEVTDLSISSPKANLDLGKLVLRHRRG
jgi:hypothetical protein